MAGILNRAGGRRTVYFNDHNGKRHWISLGKTSQRNADEVKRHVEHLVNSTISQLAPPDATAHWLAKIGGSLRAAFIRTGLLSPSQHEEPQSTAPTLGSLFDSYIENRKAAASSKIVWRRARRCVCDYLGEDRPIDTLKVGDALRWRDAMLTRPESPMAETTVRKMTQVARQVFRRAVKDELLTRNPFVDEDLPVVVGEREKEYIELATVERLCEHVPSIEWRAVLILARVAGLRVQSEGPLLQWGHVDWARGRLTVPDQKRQTTRSVPLFLKLRAVLADLDAAAKPGEHYILPTVRKLSRNWATPLKKWAEKAGIQPWPAFFNSLRASAETDIAREFGVHLATEWVGNSVKVALKHYVRATDADYDRATGQRATQAQRHLPVTARNDPELPCNATTESQSLQLLTASDGVQEWTILDSNQ